MSTLSEPTLELITYLQSCGIDPILYGSQGVSLYLGDFKTFNDVDLLVGNKLLNDGWPNLQRIMHDHGFSLVDEHEHEFKNTLGTSANFADESILIRDSILSNLTETVHIDIEGYSIRTLPVGAFKRAYEFSVKDGYRVETRGKKDGAVIELLENYLQKKAQR